MPTKGLKVVLVAGLAGVVVLVCVAVGAWFVRPRPSAHPEPASTRDGRWRQDLEYLAANLTRLHANAFHTVPRPVFEDQVRALLDSIPRLDDHEVLVRMAGIVASVGDAHTSMGASSRGAARLPIMFRWFSDGLYVTAAVRAFEHLAKAEILSIEGTQVGRALGTIGAVVSHENEVGLRVAGTGYLRNVDVLHALGLIQRRDSASLTFRTVDGDTTVVRLPALGEIPRDEWTVPTIEQPLYWQRLGEPFWDDTLDSGRTLYVRYRRCTDPWGFWGFARRIGRKLEDARLQRLIIDFRGNGGGNSWQFTYLLLGKIRRSRLNDRGRLFGLVDEATFSSAALNAAELRRETAAILVGQSASGRATGYGNVRAFTLPNSGFTVWYASAYFPPDPELGGEGSLKPDMEVPLSSAAYFGGLDRALDTIRYR
jgi:hypothetical protein